MPDHILSEREGAVRIVVLNRPDKRSAMGQEMRRALVELFDEIEGDAALVRLADILAHYVHGAAVSPADMLRVARTAGVGSGELRAVLFALPQASGVGKRRVVEACPLSARERDVPPPHARFPQTSGPGNSARLSASSVLRV